MPSRGSCKPKDSSLPLVTTRHYESGPPATYNLANSEDPDTFAVTKQEEWVTKRKTEYTTTKQIETRVQRQVLLEDGQVIEDSGPLVTTNTTQDTETQEHEHTEHKTNGDDPPPREGWLAIPGAVVVREKNEKKTTTRDETEERVETQEAHHLGELTSDDLVKALRDKSDIRLSLIQRRSSATGDELDNAVGLKGQQLVPLSTKKVVHQSKKHHRVIDEEDTQEHSEEKDGKIITETTRHSHHEEFDDEEFPDDEQHSKPSSVHEITKETSRNYSHIKDEDQVEYLAVPRGGRLAEGVKLGEGMHLTSETIQQEQDGDEREWESLSDRIRKSRKLLASQGLKPVQKTDRESSLERKDVLTLKPLNLEAEEETRKQETSRWLESHFGSESSRSSFDPDLDDQQAVSGGGISVTMKSRSSREETPQTSDSFVTPPSCVPPPPPEPDYKIYATPKSLLKGSHEKKTPEPLNTPTKMHTGRYAGYSDRVQVLPIGPGHMFNLRTVSPNATPPVSPLVKNNFVNGNSPLSPNWPSSNDKATEPPVNAKPWQQHPQQTANDLYSVPVKRSTSFNNTSKSFLTPWHSKKEEDVVIQPKSENIYHLKEDGPRKSISSSFREYRNQHQDNLDTSKHSDIKYREELRPNGTPARREWPPRNSMDEEDEKALTSTSRGGTVIKLGPRDYSPDRKESKLQSSQSFRVTEAFNPRFREERRGSLNPFETPYRNKIVDYEPNSLPEFRGNERNNKDSRSTSDRYRIEQEPISTSPPKLYKVEVDMTGHTKYPNRAFKIKSSEDLIPEREISPVQKPTHPIIEEITPALQSRKPAKAPAPPRPSPPNTNGYSIPSRCGMFATDSPPVRPERRKTKNKTDSGTQTLTRRTEITTQTLDRTKPKKKYYLGEDPFRDNVPVNPFKDPNDEVELIDMLRRHNGVHLTRNGDYSSMTMGRRGSADIVGQQQEPATQRYQGIDEGLRSQTLPRKPKAQKVHESRREEIYGDRNNNDDKEHRGSETKGTEITRRNHAEHQNRSMGPGLARSQSFHQPNQELSNQAKASVSFSDKNREGRNSNPLYKSTPFLNRAAMPNSAAPLRSPGIISSISKSQLDLSKSQNELREESSLYTLPRNRGILRNSANQTPLNANSTNGSVYSPASTSLYRSHSTVQPRLRPQQFQSPKVLDATTDSSPKSNSNSNFHPLSRMNKEVSQSELSLNRFATQREVSNRLSSHNNKTQRSFREEIVDDHAEGQLTLQQRKAKLISSLPNGKIHDSPLPRVIAGQVKKSAPEPPPKPKSPTRQPERRVSPQPEIDESRDENKRQRFLNGLLTTAPELFMHIHGEEDLSQFHVRGQDEIDGKVKRTPSPQTPPPPLQKAPSPYGDSPNYSRGSPVTNNAKYSRVYTSTPVLNRLPESRQPILKTYVSPSSRVDQENRLNQSQNSRSQINSSHKLANNADLSLSSSHRGSPNHTFNSQPNNSSLRRSSLTPSSSFRSGKDSYALVHRPKPENYSETFHIRSKGDPTMGNDSETDTIQTFSKRTVPLKDGFSTETIESSEKKTVTRSHYTDTEQSHPRDASLRYMDIKPQQSGGVIIEVRDWNGH